MKTIKLYTREEVIEFFDRSRKIIETHPIGITNEELFSLFLDRKSKEVPFDITPEYILEIVSKHTGISVGLMKSKSRKEEIVSARKRYFWIAYRKTGISSPKIGAVIGQGSSNTLITIGKIQKRLELDKKRGTKITEKFRQDVDIIVEKIETLTKQKLISR